MSAFERFDLNGRAASPRVVAQRWREFHREVRAVSSGRLARIVGPWLGDDTRRRRMLEKLRPAPVGATSIRATPSVFPENYVPTVAHLAHTKANVTESVEFVVLASDEPAELYEKFTRALASSREWLMVTREERDPPRLTCAAQLLPYGEGVDVVFADEVGDAAMIPLLKPSAVGPHTLLSYNVIGRPALLRRETVARVGGLREDAKRASEHDLYLRLLEARAVFRHVPVVLAGRSAGERHHAELGNDTVRIVAQALHRRGVNAHVGATAIASVVTWSPVLVHWPSVDIVIPTRDRLDLLRACIGSVEESSYPDFNIVILNNGSVQTNTLQYLERTPYRVVDCPGPFNYAAIINRGIATCSAQYIVTLNNDTIVRRTDWLEQMVGVASLDDVSVVGATLLDRNDVHEHDGIIIAPYPQHLRRGVNYLIEDEFVVARRDVAAVTGAVQMISRTTYLELGGMDEQLAVVMNDVDLCLRSQANERHVVVLPDVVFSHFAGSTRGRLDPLEDRNRFVQRWDVFGELVDPYFAESLRLYGTTMKYCPPEADSVT